MKQVVILAGGKGTRLRERLGDLPKPLLDICGVPLLERQILLAKRFGAERVLILVSYRAQAIVDYCESKRNWGIDIVCVDDGEPRGTAGAVLNVLDLLDHEFLLLYGDTMLEVDLERFERYHALNKSAAATLFLHPNDHPADSDLVDMDDNGRITGFHPYPHPEGACLPNLVNAALYCIRRDALNPWSGYSGDMLDFGKHLFPAMISSGYVLRGYNSPEYIKDCGTPGRVDKVCADFLAGKISRSVLDQMQMAVFVDRDGTLNREVDHLRSPEQFELLPGVEQAMRRLNQSEYRVCVVTNQPVVARGECSKADLKQIHNKLETLLGEAGAYVDRIYYCPHHPEKGFKGEVAELKVDCVCRKPNIGMLEQAVGELNVNLRNSWMVGDTTTDLLLAQRAGVRSILVETGYAGLDANYWVVPDFTVPDFAAAVSLILDNYPEMIRSMQPLLQDVRPGDVLFVGGQSRSGKSSYATVMRDVLRARGLSCHVLSTDRWLLSEADRGANVLNRHDRFALLSMVETLLARDTIPIGMSLPGYRKSTREAVPDVDTLIVAPTDIVIIEGVVALYLAQEAGARCQYFVEIEESVREQRVIREYLLRGYPLASAQQIYVTRLQEEVPWVVSTASRAVRFMGTVQAD